MYQNGYLHGSRSRGSVKSAIYTAAGCQHKIAIDTATVPEQIPIYYTAAVCPHKIFSYTAVIQEPNWLYTLLPCVYIKLLFTRQPFKSQIAAGCIQKSFFIGSHSSAKSAIYIAAGCIQKIVIYMAAVREQIQDK